MGQGSGIREIAWLDIAGGGQAFDGNHAYIGHMDPPHGTSVLDVSDPANPRIIASIHIPSGLHSHKVRVANDIMVVNRERARGEKPADDFVGLRIFDVSQPATPRDICHWNVPAWACTDLPSMAATPTSRRNRKAMSAPL